MPFSAKALLSPPQSPKRYRRDDNSGDAVLLSEGSALCASADAPNISSRMKHKRMFGVCAQGLARHWRKFVALLQGRIAKLKNERLRSRSTCLFFIATTSKALALPNAGTSRASSKVAFSQAFRNLESKEIHGTEVQLRHRASRFGQRVRRTTRSVGSKFS
jgi:hypothetical protein